MKKLILTMVVFTLFINSIYCTCDYYGSVGIPNYSGDVNFYRYNSSSIYITQSWSVGPGSVLIFDSNRNYIVSPGVTITVQPGGKIDIKDCTFSACDVYWNGIIVNGHNIDPQWDIYGNRMYGDHGWLKVLNSSFSHMKNGIVINDGGIVKIELSNFINNLNGLVFNEYTPVEPSGWPDGKELVNAAVIEENFFEWDDYLINWGSGTETDYEAYCFVTINECDRVSLGGNKFYNNDVDDFSKTGRGVGVNIYNSSFGVHDSKLIGFNSETKCPIYGQNPQQSEFGYLTTGIYFIHNDLVDRYAYIWNTKFYWCARGVHLEGGINNIIKDNDFYFDSYNFNNRFDDLSTSYEPNFIYTKGGKEFLIAENLLRAYEDNFAFMITEDSGDEYENGFNTIRKNYFVNFNAGNAAYGNVIIGNCENLRLKCNEYSWDYYESREELYYDWLIEEGAYLGQQGANGSATGNKYSRTDDYNIMDNGDQGVLVIYYYNEGDPDIQTPVVESSGIPELHEEPIDPDCDDLDCDELFSINENDLQLPILLYPNPSDSKITIEISQAEVWKYEYEIYNILGELQLHGKHKGASNLELNINSYQTGLYIIKIISDNGKFGISEFIKY